jgi:D-alanine-D-alanine ligase
MGGISPEHPVSLASGCGILAKLDRSRYEGFPVLIARDNVWVWPAGPARFPESLTVEQVATILNDAPEGWNRVPFVPNSPDATPGDMLLFPQADVFFLALHGVGGEDGTLQAYLESLGQPFTGSGSLGSQTSMDKIRSKEKYREHGIPTAPWVVVSSAEPVPATADQVERTLGLPAVVKHPTGGSSIGVAVAKTRAQLEAALAEIGRDTPHILVEAFIPGREATCGVLEGFATALPPTEIRPKKDSFFSFEEKYTSDGADEITPAAFPPEVNAEIQRLAAKAHAALGLAVYSRTDFIWTGSTGSPQAGSSTLGHRSEASGSAVDNFGGTLNALETNNLPGFTPKSILPQQAAEVGLSYTDLVTHVIEQSLLKG